MIIHIMVEVNQINVFENFKHVIDILDEGNYIFKETSSFSASAFLYFRCIQ